MSRNKPPRNRITSRPDTPCSPMKNQGLVSRVSHTIENSSSTRVTIANASPLTRAELRCAGGSRPTRIEMKMMLSMPRTISSNDSVTNAIQACGSVKSSSIVLRQVVHGGLLDRREHVLGFQSQVERGRARDVDG